ncbi:MAG: hypothetical protein EHM48_03910 [Planctomycetaceae bacterium]|nr:MAG: hypothetical protein EHM48_03910 [Planctomycetaceae bacterium]
MRKYIAIFVVVAVLAAGVSYHISATLGESPAATMPTTQQAKIAGTPASVPASAPTSRAALEAYPSPALVAACKQTGKTVQSRLDKTFSVIVAPPFVIAGNLSATRLQSFADACVTKPSAALWKGYFDKKPDQVITVMLFGDDKSYRSWAKKLFGDTDVSHFGYYRPDIRTLVMNIDTGGGTLIHELTHSLIVYDFPGVPTWFNEGFASLHEQCNVGEDTIVGMENWRLKELQDAIRKKELASLKTMITRDDFYGPQQGINYAQSRYLCLYMQRKGLLKDFYKYYRANHEGKDAGIQAVEHVFKKKLDAIEKEYLAWVMTLKFE